jgi:hypothetical protein
MLPVDKWETWNGGDAVLDATRDTICPADVEFLKARPEAADPARWIPLLLAELERLRARIAEQDGQSVR